jgi:hypothetical protein
MFTKHIRYRGSHQPLNVALVVTFLVLGSTRAEPLDFWWAPMNPWMVTAYAVIIGGGLLITRRLRLLAMAATFWISLTVGIGILAASGHCITARWSFTPVCGFEFWRIIITSPEIMIFLFFMITDPKTVPAGRVGRACSGCWWRSFRPVDGPQDTEFGSKVAHGAVSSAAAPSSTDWCGQARRTTDCGRSSPGCSPGIVARRTRVESPGWVLSSARSHRSGSAWRAGARGVLAAARTNIGCPATSTHPRSRRSPSIRVSRSRHSGGALNRSCSHLPGSN